LPDFIFPSYYLFPAMYAFLRNYFRFLCKKGKFSQEFIMKNYFLDFWQERIFIGDIIPLNLIK